MTDDNRNRSEFRKHVFGDRLAFSTRSIFENEQDEEQMKTDVMDNLISKLKEFEKVPGMSRYSESYVSHDQEHAYAYPLEARQLMQEIEQMADSHLITDSGNPDTVNIGILIDEGYSVNPGDQDAYGWLTGVITTRCGKIVFG